MFGVHQSRHYEFLWRRKVKTTMNAFLNKLREISEFWCEFLANKLFLFRGELTENILGFFFNHTVLKPVALFF